MQLEALLEVQGSGRNMAERRFQAVQGKEMFIIFVNLLTEDNSTRLEKPQKIIQTVVMKGQVQKNSRQINECTGPCGIRLDSYMVCMQYSA